MKDINKKITILIFSLSVVIILYLIVYLSRSAETFDRVSRFRTISVPATVISVSPKPLQRIDTLADDATAIRIKLAEWFGLPPGQLEMKITNNTGTSAKGTFKEKETEGDTEIFLAVRVGGNWTIIYNGESVPPCYVLRPYDFPARFVPECMNEEDVIIKR